MSNEMQTHIEETSSQVRVSIYFAYVIYKVVYALLKLTFQTINRISTASKLENVPPQADRWLTQLLESTYKTIKEEWGTIFSDIP